MVPIPGTLPTRQTALLARAGPLIAATGYFLALAVLMTWPLILNFSVAVPGNGYDSWQNIWNLWQIKQAVLEGYAPFATRYLYYPQGLSLYLHTLSPLNFLVSLPVQAGLGLIVAYNFVVLFSLTASGVSAYLLGYALTASRGAALVAGTVFATSGYLLAQVLGGHANLFAAEWLPLAVLGVLRAARRPGRGSVILAAALIALNVLCDWQYVLIALMFAAWYGLALLIDRRSVRAVLPVVLVVAGALLLVLPLAVPTAALAARTPTAATEGGPLFRIQNALDLADLVIPSQLHPLWGRTAEALQSYKAWQEIQNKTGYLGVVTLLLALLTVRTAGSRFWWATAAVFTVLALGPRLQLAGTVTPIPLPSALLYDVPLVNISRYPLRFLVMTMLALAVLAALGSRRLAQWATTRRALRIRRPFIYGALLCAVLLDNLTLPLPMIAVYIPPPYAALAEEPDGYGIFEAPLNFRTSAAYLLYQTVHGKPIVGGYTSRSQAYALLDEIPVLRSFAEAAPQDDIIAQQPESIAASVFSYFKIRYLLLHSSGGALRNQELERVARAASGGEPEVFGESILARDARTASRLPRVLGRVPLEPPSDVLMYRLAPPSTATAFLGLGMGWSVPRTEGAHTVRRVAAAAEVAVYSERLQSINLTMELSTERRGTITLAIQGQASRQLVVEAGEQSISVPLSLQAGRTSLWLRVESSAPVDVSALDLAERDAP